jgi:hypothetical protein
MTQTIEEEQKVVQESDASHRKITLNYQANQV